MVIKKNDMKTEIREKMREGEGTVNIRHYADKSIMHNVRLMAHITIPSGASIGKHKHIDETEYFIILKGSALVCDNDIEKKLTEGDIIITGNQETHSIKNICDGDLELIAVIITYV